MDSATKKNRSDVIRHFAPYYNGLLKLDDGVVPDERQMYVWIKAAFQHFFNNVQQDPVVQIQGLRACRQLLIYLLREIAIQRQRLRDGQPVPDTMLTRLVQFQHPRSFRPTEGTSRHPPGAPPPVPPTPSPGTAVADSVIGLGVHQINRRFAAACAAAGLEGRRTPVAVGNRVAPVPPLRSVRAR